MYSSIDVLTDIPLKLSSSIGGLDNQLKEIVRRLLLSRQLPSDLMYALGLTHVTGLLLYGPPGTGKTLIARELSALLTSRPVQIVNGPELLDKYVGEAERNIRQLFKAADDEWEEAGQRSALHVIIFDEFDSIAKKRGMLAGMSMPRSLYKCIHLCRVNDR
jgi:vesicle-fusing ATPase